MVVLCEDPDTLVRIAASKTLASLTTKKLGKKKFCKRNGVELCVKLLQDESDETKINALQTVSNIVEWPKIRQNFKEYLPIITKLETSSNELVARFALIAKSSINWVP